MGEARTPIEFHVNTVTKEAEKPKFLELPQEIVNRLDQETLNHGMNECCGFVLEFNGKMEVVAVTNLLIAQGKAQYRYEMDTDDVIKIHERLLKENGKVIALYHSHTNHDKSHFSGSDAAHALQSFYSETPYIVLAAKSGKVYDRKAYTYSAQSKSFIESQVVAPKHIPFQQPLVKAA